MAFQDGPRVVLGLEKARHYGVLERPQRNGLRLVGGERAQRRGNAAPQVCASFQNRVNHPFIAGNAASQARANASSGEVSPASVRLMVALSQGTRSPSSLCVIAAASRARRTSLPKWCMGDAPGVKVRIRGMAAPCCIVAPLNVVKPLQSVAYPT